MARSLPTRSDATAPEFAELFHREIELKFDGQTEILNRILEHYLRAYTSP